MGRSIELVEKTNPIQLVMKANGQELDFDVLPDGLRSMLSWLGDLLMRLDGLKWQDNIPVFDRNIILFLDEIEVHLHPAWQRRILPVIQKLFKNAQIFLTTHSPFIANSVEGAFIYELALENGNSSVSEVDISNPGESYRRVLREVFGIEEQFGVPVQEDLKEFYQQLQSLQHGTSKVNEKAFLKLAKNLAAQSEELKNIIIPELKQLSLITEKVYMI